MSWEHTGRSANIDFYAEMPRRKGSLWCEVLRSGLMRIDGVMQLVNPTYHFGLYRLGVGEVDRFKYRFQRNPGRSHILSSRTVARLVNERLGTA